MRILNEKILNVEGDLVTTENGVYQIGCYYNYFFNQFFQEIDLHNNSRFCRLADTYEALNAWVNYRYFGFEWYANEKKMFSKPIKAKHELPTIAKLIGIEDGRLVFEDYLTKSKLLTTQCIGYQCIGMDNVRNNIIQPVPEEDVMEWYKGVSKQDFEKYRELLQIEFNLSNNFLKSKLPEAQKHNLEENDYDDGMSKRSR